MKITPINTLLISFIGNIFLSILKIVAGIIGNSKSLIADGIHSFSDLSTDIVAIIGIKLSNKPADKDHPYGHGKYEYITSSTISITIILLGLFLIIDSFKGNPSVPDIKIVFVTIVTIISKYILSSFILKKGQEFNNQILISSGKESLLDVLTSVFVFFIILVSQLSRVVKAFNYVDKLGSLIIGLFIIINGIQLLRNNLSCLLGKVEENIEIYDKINEIIKSNYHNVILENLLLVKYGPYYQTTIKIALDKGTNIKTTKEMIDNIENKIKANIENIGYITTSINVIDEGCDVNARTTRSRNSKRNSKKKSPKQKNK